MSSIFETIYKPFFKTTLLFWIKTTHNRRRDDNDSPMQTSKIFLTALVFLFILHLHAQSPDNFLLQIGSPDSSEYSSAITSDENEDLYLAAIVFHKIRRNQRLKLSKISKSGRVLWSRLYPDKERSIFSIVKQSDKSLILAGSVQDSAGQYMTEGSALLMKTDASGNPLWEKIYKFGDRGSIYELFQTDGGYLLQGSGFTDRSPGKELEIFLYKTDFEGNVLWKKVFQMDEARGELLMTPLKNGNFFCVLENHMNPTRLFTLTPAGDILHEIKVPYTDITSVMEKGDGQMILFQTERIEQDSGRARNIIHAKTLQGDSLVTLKKLTAENLRSDFHLAFGDFYTSYGTKNKLTLVKLSPDFEIAAEAAMDLPAHASLDGFLITDQKSLVVIGILAVPLDKVDPAAKSKLNFDIVIRKVSLSSLFKN